VWRLEDVSIRQDQLELRGLTIEIPAGSVLGLAGLDGSGQQLFLRLLAGLLRPSAGRVWLNGQDVTGAPATLFRRAGVQHLPADRLADGLVGAMSLSEHIALQEAAHSWLLNMPGAERAAQAAIATYDIKATPALPMASLSGGNQQRAMLALLPDHCAGVLLDQPTRGLDVASARGVWQRLLARRSDGTAIVFASSDFDELLDHSDRILVFFSCRVSHPLPRTELNQARLAELIGGVGFEASDGG
jgi:simple sugar transport system ATP-binding protein